MARIPLFIDLKVGQSISIDGGRIVMSLEDKSGKLARLKFVADSDVSIQRPGSAEQRRFKSGARQAAMGINLS